MEYTIGDKYDFISAEIEVLIENQEKMLKLSEEREKNNKKDNNGLFTRLFSSKTAVDERKEKLGQYNKLNTLLYDIYQFDSKGYQFDSELKGKMDAVCQFLSDEEIKKIKETINGCVRGEFEEIVNKKEEQCDEFIKLLNKTGLYKHTVHSRNNQGITLEPMGSMISIFNQFKTDLLTKIRGEHYVFNGSKVSNVYDDGFMKEIGELLGSKYFEETPDNLKIKNNFGEIKSAYADKERLEKTIMSLDSCINALRGDVSVDFGSVIKILEDLKVKNLKELRNREAYLGKFNLEGLRKDIKKKYEKEQEKYSKEQWKLSYQRLYYDLLEARDKEPDNLEKIKEIEAKLRECSSKGGLENRDLDDAVIKASYEYSNEKSYKQAVAKGKSEDIVKRDEVRKEVYENLRKMAIRELELSGQLDSIDPVVRDGGDISYAAELQEQERLISQKMEEIAKTSEMTPEERGFAYLKEKGLIDENADVSSLTAQQRRDFNFAYRDASYQFVSEYKNGISSKFKRTPYAEYIRYRASLEDKSKAISFSEFVKNVYNMTDEEEFVMANESGGRKR